MGKKTAKEIDEASALWVARRDRGLTFAEEQELNAWLSADDRHLGSFGRMRALSLHTERSAGLGPAFRPEQFRRGAHAAPSRRWLIGSAVAGAAAASAGGVFLFASTTGRYTTRRGEVRVIALADGSVITLNTASRIAVRLTRRQRLIQLLDGEALFDVAKDPNRPFLVSAGQITVRAVGTSFTVRRLPSTPVQVLVQEGVVEVRDAGAPLEQAVRLSANMRGVLTSAAAVTAAPIAPAELQRQLTWRQGRLSFDGETLAEASAEFARYSDTRIVIDDPDLAREEISGSYLAQDPVGFSRAAAEAFGARVEVGDSEVRLLR